MTSNLDRGGGSQATKRSTRAPQIDVGRPEWLASRPALLVLALVVAVVSFAVSVLSALVSRMAWRPGTVVVPWGLVLGVVASVSIVYLARTYTRVLGFVAAAGWIIGTALVVGGRPEGDYLLAEDALGIGYLVLSSVPVIGMAAAGGPR
jgi:ABC-type polysaccharide/polyol phosphate export permease